MYTFNLQQCHQKKKTLECNKNQLKSLTLYISFRKSANSLRFSCRYCFCKRPHTGQIPKARFASGIFPRSFSHEYLRSEQNMYFANRHKHYLRNIIGFSDQMRLSFSEHILKSLMFLCLVNLFPLALSTSFCVKM